MTHTMGFNIFKKESNFAPPCIMLISQPIQNIQRGVLGLYGQLV